MARNKTEEPKVPKGPTMWVLPNTTGAGPEACWEAGVPIALPVSLAKPLIESGFMAECENPRKRKTVEEPSRRPPRSMKRPEPEEEEAGADDDGAEPEAPPEKPRGEAIPPPNPFRRKRRGQ